MTVLISALVAAVITLGIEFFAKPSLEARKDRIVDQQRSRRGAKQAFGTVSFHVGQIGLLHRSPTGIPDVDQKRLTKANDLLRSNLEDLQSRLAAGGDELDGLGKAGVYHFSAAAEAYVFFVDNLGPDAAPTREFFARVVDPMVDMVDELLKVPRWQGRRGRRLRAELDALR